MNKNILNTGVQDFIFKNLNADITSVLLKGTSFPEVTTQEIIQQLESRKKCEHKLPTWFKPIGIFYPPKLSVEQSSSEITARYKASLIHGKNIIDLSGGFGVDAFYFANSFENVIHCEINKELSEIVTHNYAVLKIDNVKCSAGDGISILKEINTKFDWIYLDPARRDDKKNKVFLLSDCTPDVTVELPFIFKYTDCILIKTSPILDIAAGLKTLQHVKEIHVVAIKNEVKELLWILEKEYIGNPQITTINFLKDKQDVFKFYSETEKTHHIVYEKPLNYLYEPNAAILKAGAFKSICSVYNIAKLHVNSHLYTSNSLIDFPGRRFEVLQILPYNKKSIKELKKIDAKANITTRNFNLSVSELRKITKIKEGGDLYYFFTINVNNERVIIRCHKR